jgi:hypothetical protein
MHRVEVRPFAAADVPPAAALLGERHRRQRERQPLLSMNYEKVDAAAAVLASALALDDASGAVAVRDGAVIGYLLGAPKTNPAWGANVWVEAAGQALAPGTPAEVMRDVYAAWPALGFEETFLRLHRLVGY